MTYRHRSLPTEKTMALRTLRFAAILSVIACAAAGPLFAQSAGPAPSGREYRLQVLYRPGIAQSYEITEVDSVVRTHSDSSTKSYARQVTYFTTVRCLESQEGFSTVAVNLDSMQYRFTADGMEVTYDSQKDVTVKHFADLNNYVGPLNRTAELRYNPYGDVVSVKGEQLDWIRTYLQENGEGMDSVVALIWEQSVADPNLLQYADLQKRVIPGRKAMVDSSWQHRMALRIDGVVFDGTVRSTLAKYGGGLYTITTRDTIPAAKAQPVHVYGISYITTVLDGEAIVDNTIQLAATGSLNEVSSRVRARFRGKAYNEIFTNTITSTTTWKLTGQYQW